MNKVIYSFLVVILLSTPICLYFTGCLAGPFVSDYRGDGTYTKWLPWENPYESYEVSVEEVFSTSDTFQASYNIGPLPPGKEVYIGLRVTGFDPSLIFEDIYTYSQPKNELATIRFILSEKESGEVIIEQVAPITDWEWISIGDVIDSETSQEKTFSNGQKVKTAVLLPEGGNFYPTKGKEYLLLLSVDEPDSVGLILSLELTGMRR